MDKNMLKNCIKYGYERMTWLYFINMEDKEKDTD